MAENNIKIFTVKVDTTQGKIAIDGLTKGFVKSQTAINNLNKELANTTKKGLNPLTDATGLAGAAVNELGRTASDAGYGITAVANNISQLGSLMAILIARTGGLKNALSAMGKQFVGPLGILFVFQAAVAAIEYFSRETKKASDAVGDLNNSFSEQSTKLQAYVKILNDSNVPLEEKKELVEELNEEHKDLNLQLNEESRLTEESTRLTDEYIKSLEKKAKAQNIITRIQKIYNEQLNRETEEIGENLTFFDKLATAFTIRKDYNKDIINEEKSIRKKTEADEEANKELEKLTGLLNEIGIIPEINTKKDENRLKRKKEFVAKELSFADEILKSEDRIADKITKNQFARLDQEEELQVELAKIKQKEFADRELKRANAIKDEEDRKKAIAEANYAIERSLASLSEYEIQLAKETEAIKTQIVADALVKQFDLAVQLNAKERESILSFEATMATNELDKLDAERRLNDEKLSNTLNALEIEKQKRIENGEFYGDLLIKEEQAKNKSERTKTRIEEKEQKTRLAIANQVGQAIIGIAGQGSAVGKAVAVAMAIMNTKEAITAALGAKPYGPWNIAQAIAVGAFGFKQVKDIMATKLPVEAGAGGASASGGASLSVEAPDFNVVGTGGASQLASTLAGETRRPIRAFVVSKEMSSAQELDRNISSNAALD